MSEAKSYPDFLDDIGKLLQSAMPRTDRERDELYAAEAECRRLREQLAVANERRELAFTRYNRERDLLREMFDTWKSEVMSPSLAFVRADSSTRTNSCRPSG